MLKHVADLSPNFEYGLVWWGQSVARPWGTKAQGFAQAPQLQLDEVGKQLTGLNIVSGTGLETLIVSPGTLTAGEWNGATLRLGTNTAAVAGYARVVSNGTGSLLVTWVVNAGALGAQAAYVVRENMKWASYPNVRVLTPYQPSIHVGPASAETQVPYPSSLIPWAATSGGGRAFAMPGFSVAPFTANSFDTLGCFLPFTFAEGVDSWGIAENNDASGTGTHPFSAAAAGTFTWTNGGTPPPVNYFTDGYIRVEWEAAGLPKLSWARVASNTATVATLNGAWQGDGTPSNVKRYELWVPHFNNSPWHYLPGESFSYPSAEMQPFAMALFGPVYHNRPRGNTNFGYDDRFGAMLQFAWRLSSAIGKRVNVINLGVNGASQVPMKTQNTVAFQGIVGWFDHTKCFDWTPSNPEGNAARLSKLIRTMASRALLAEGNSKPLRILGIAGMQLESDSTTPEGRDTAARTFRTFLDWLRGEIDGAGLNPYSGAEKIPVWHQQIATAPWNILDTELVIRNVIAEAMASDGFGVTTEVDDLTKLSDQLHFTGGSEAINGARGAEAIGPIIEFALSHGSAALQHNLQAELAIWNQALAHVGETTTILDPVTDTSVQADWCRRLYPSSLLTLLGLRQWAFALRRVPLVLVDPPPSPLYDHYRFCYVVPPEALNSFTVLPPHPNDDYLLFGLTVDALGIARPDGVVRADVPYNIEQSPFGHRLLFTNQEQATLRFVRKEVDASRYPPAFASALALHLASMVASSHIRGDVGEAVSQRMLKKMGAYLGASSTLNGNQRSAQIDHIPQHLADR